MPATVMGNEQDILMTVFSETLRRHSAEERDAYLTAACANDPALRAQVEALLKAHAKLGNFLKPPFGDLPEAEGQSAVIGRYKLLEQIGEGGFGVVYMAEQLEPIRRRVALKIVKPGMDTRQVIARFEAERQALASLDHPNIARVYDAGATPTGRPYFVMELVQGAPLTQFCDTNQLVPRERLKLFMNVCDAVQHAHQKGIVHRDLKPSNILVTLHDGKPVPKVIDFGTAKALQQPLTEKTLFTGYGRLIGTPQYTSPEQAEMSGLGVDTRADVYSLGVLLYELLTGTTPFEVERLRGAAFEEMMRIIRQEEPPKPSTRVSTLGERATTIAKYRQVEPALLRRTLQGDLDWIVMKALEKDRERRYGSARDLAADLLRHLEERPVLAGPPGKVYRLRKFARRRRSALIAAGSFAAVVAVAGILGYWQTARARKAEQQAASRETQLRSALGTAGNLSMDARALRLITGVVNVEPEASLSPDESMLAYANWDGPDGDLMVRELKTGNVRNLTESEKHLPGERELCPDVHVWSPDSKSIAYMWSSFRNGLVPELRLVSIANGGIRTLIPLDPAIYFRPLDWSADGRQLLCDRVDKVQNRSSLAMVEIASGQVRDLGVASGKHARLSPDGLHIVFAVRAPESRGDQQKNGQGIFLVEISSANVQRLDLPAETSTPIWAPTNAVVLFSSDRLKNWDLWGLLIENGRPASDAFPVRYGVGPFDKRFTRSGKLIIQRKMRAGDGYTIAGGAPATDVPALEPFPGRIYLALGSGLYTLTSEAGGAEVRPVGTGGLPSRELHGGACWFLQTREVQGRTTPAGGSRHEIFAVTLKGASEIAVRLTDNAQQEVAGDLHWAADPERRLADGRASWLARSADDTQPGIYSARVRFDRAGLVTGLLEAPSEPLVAAAESHDWSPDGLHLAYSVRAGAGPEIRILDLRTRQTRTLTEGSAPVWSPDGLHIAFRRGHRAIHTILPDGSGLTTVLRREERPGGVQETAPESGYYELVWAPDSSALLYGFLELGGGKREVLRVARGGGEPCLLTRSVLDSAVPVAWLKEAN